MVTWELCDLTIYLDSITLNYLEIAVLLLMAIGRVHIPIADSVLVLIGFCKKQKCALLLSSRALKSRFFLVGGC